MSSSFSLAAAKESTTCKSTSDDLSICKNFLLLRTKTSSVVLCTQQYDFHKRNVLMQQLQILEVRTTKIR